METEEQKARRKFNRINKIEIYERKARKVARLIMLLGCEVCPANKYCKTLDENKMNVKDFNYCKKCIVEWLQKGEY